MASVSDQELGVRLLIKDQGLHHKAQRFYLTHLANSRSQESNFLRVKLFSSDGASPIAMVFASSGAAVIMSCVAEAALQVSEPGGPYLYLLSLNCVRSAHRYHCNSLEPVV